MQLSSSTDLHQDARGQKHCFSITDAIYAFKAAGFTHADLTFAEHCGMDSPFAKNSWREWLGGIQDALGRTGLTVHQTHTLFYDHIDTPERLAFHEKMTDRCIEASAMVGAKWTVMHILRVKDLNLSPEQKDEALRLNANYFRPYGEKARKTGIGIAIENGFTGFFHSAPELLALLERIGDDAFGLCWDTGHANLTGQDQPASIRLMGEHLKCLHINDNHGRADEHLLPYFGTVEFRPIIQAIRALSHPPVLSFECRGSTRSLPAPLHADMLRTAVRIGEYLGSC